MVPAPGARTPPAFVLRPAARMAGRAQGAAILDLPAGGGRPADNGPNETAGTAGLALLGHHVGEMGRKKKKLTFLTDDFCHVF